MELINVTVHKYKSFETDQTFDVQKDITILVGMNESGKTSVLEAIGKTNYFQKDSAFEFSLTHDYPRREKKAIDKAEKTPDAISCVYAFTQNVIDSINGEFGKGFFSFDPITISSNYKNGSTINFTFPSREKFLEDKIRALGIHSATMFDKLKPLIKSSDLEKVIREYKDEGILAGLAKLKPYYENKNDWHDPIGEYIYRKHIKPNLPKFLYYDEYYSLPSRIVIEELAAGKIDQEEMKTAKALLELANLNPKDILEANSFEDYIAELEATEAIISDELFKYWTTNKNLNIEFKIEAREGTESRSVSTGYGEAKVVDAKIIEHILDIRVKNQRSRVSLPLRNRSKGFNWFFSFLVWFKKIQEDKGSKYILLLDEPGLNLHASAQADLLKFLEDLSVDYQIIYTTHSPFAIPSDKLHRVRTVLETQNGSQISESIQEKDPNTLFPLQAALGYDIAQNLFIGKKNLIVEGVSDLVFLETMSAILQSAGRTGLDGGVTVIPTGGLEKVATFISLMRGNKLDLVCLLDSYTDASAKAKFENIIQQKLIHEKKVRFFHDYLPSYKQADIEDLFATADYLKLFNAAFIEHADIAISDVSQANISVLQQINTKLGLKRFNHYRPANQLAKEGLSAKDFAKQTLDNFEQVFTDLNKLF